MRPWWSLAPSGFSVSAHLPATLQTPTGCEASRERPLYSVASVWGIRATVLPDAPAHLKAHTAQTSGWCDSSAMRHTICGRCSVSASSRFGIALPACWRLVLRWRWLAFDFRLHRATALLPAMRMPSWETDSRCRFFSSAACRSPSRQNATSWFSCLKRCFHFCAVALLNPPVQRNGRR